MLTTASGRISRLPNFAQTPGSGRLSARTISIGTLLGEHVGVETAGPDPLAAAQVDEHRNGFVLRGGRRRRCVRCLDGLLGRRNLRGSVRLGLRDRRDLRDRSCGGGDGDGGLSRDRRERTGDRRAQGRLGESDRSRLGLVRHTGRANAVHWKSPFAAEFVLPGIASPVETASPFLRTPESPGGGKHAPSGASLSSGSAFFAR